jgi:hypothetical protein
MKRLIHEIRQYLPRRRRRSWRYVSPRRRGVGLIVLAIVVALFYGYWYLTNEARIRRLAEQALRDFSNGAAVSIQSAKYGMFSPVKLEGVVIRAQDAPENDRQGPPIRARSIQLWHNPWKLLASGQLYPTEIVCSGAELRLVWEDSKVVNFSFFSAQAQPGGPEAPVPMDLPKPVIRFRQAKVFSYSNTSGIQKYREYPDLTVTARPLEDGSYKVEFEDADQVERGTLVVNPASGEVREINLAGIGPPGFLLPPEIANMLRELRYEGQSDSFKVRAVEDRPDLLNIQVTNASLRLPPAQGGLAVEVQKGLFQLDLERRELSVDLQGKLPEVSTARIQVTGQYGSFEKQSPFDQEDCYCDFRVTIDKTGMPRTQHLDGALRRALEEVRQRFEPKGSMGIRARIHRDPGRALDVEGVVKLQGVSATYKNFPYPVTELTGKLGFDQSGLRSVDLASQKDKIRIRGAIDEKGSMEVVVRSGQIPFDERLKKAVSKDFEVIWQRLSPRGKGAFVATVRQEPDQPWTLDLDVILNGNAGLTYSGFPYPLENLTGKIRVRADDVSFDGLESHVDARRLATLSGRITDLSSDEDYRAELTLDIQDLPLDDALRDALPAEARRVFQTLHADGVVDAAKVRVTDTPDDLDFLVEAELRGVSVAYEEFPLPIQDVTGQLTITPEQVVIGAGGGTLPLTGRHGKSPVALSGRVRYDEQTRMELVVSARELPFDQQLYLACPPAVQEVWDQFSPEGRADIDLSLTRVLSEDVRAEDEIRRYRLSIRPRKMDVRYVNFPLPLRGVEGEIAITPERVELRKLTARHKGQYVMLDGEILFEEGKRTGKMQVEARDILVNKELIEALPEEIAPLGGRLSAGGTAGMKLESMTFIVQRDGRDRAREPQPQERDGSERSESPPGPAGDPREQWNVQWQAKGVFRLDNVKMDLGLESKNVTGAVSGDLSSGPDGIAIRGELDMENIEVGPRRITDLKGKVYKKAQSPIIIFDKLEGKAHGGKLAGFAEIKLSKTVEYGLSMEFDRIDVDSLFNAGQDPAKRASVSGQLGGRVSIVARVGQEDLKAEGKVRIEKAKLYKLPVLLGFLHVVYLTLPTDSAFTEASAQYEIRKGKLVFNEILLNGNALSLVGSGNMVFKNGRLRLTFVAGPPGKLPTIGKVAEEIATFIAKGLFVIRVSGTVENPKIQSVPLQGLQKIVESILAPTKEDSAP